MNKQYTNKELSKLAMEYRNEKTSDRRRGKIVEIVGQKYKGLIHKKTVGVVKRDLEDFWQHYNIRVIKALNNWQPEKGAEFTTYLYQIVKGTLYQYLNSDYKKLKATKYKKYDKPVQVIHIDNFNDINEDILLELYPETDWDYVKKTIN